MGLLLPYAHGSQRMQQIKENKYKTSSPAIAETLHCRVGQFWPKVEDTADTIGLYSTTVT